MYRSTGTSECAGDAGDICDAADDDASSGSYHGSSRKCVKTTTAAAISSINSKSRLRIVRVREKRKYTAMTSSEAYASHGRSATGANGNCVSMVVERSNECQRDFSRTTHCPVRLTPDQTKRAATMLRGPGNFRPHGRNATLTRSEKAGDLTIHVFRWAKTNPTASPSISRRPIGRVCRMFGNWLFAFFANLARIFKTLPITIDKRQYL